MFAEAALNYNIALQEFSPASWLFLKLFDIFKYMERSQNEMTGSLYHSNITGFLSSACVVMGENKRNLHNVISQQIRGFWRMFSIREALKKKLFRISK